MVVPRRGSQCCLRSLSIASLSKDFLVNTFFIRFGDQRKRKLSLLLRSIAYQIVLGSALSKSIASSPRSTSLREKSDMLCATWARVFKSVLFSLREQQSLYWIIDGLDEADYPRALFRLLPDLTSSSLPIRIILVSRKISEIAAAFQRIPKVLTPTSLSIEGHLEDLQHYTQQELSMSGAAEFKEGIVQRVIEGAQNNFLVCFAKRYRHILAVLMIQ